MALGGPGFLRQDSRIQSSEQNLLAHSIHSDFEEIEKEKENKRI